MRTKIIKELDSAISNMVSNNLILVRTSTIKVYSIFSAYVNASGIKDKEHNSFAVIRL
jgi:hypothetical protein